MTFAVVAFGSNIPPRREAIREALRGLARTDGVRLIATSALRETKPVDAPTGSGDFINGACLLDTSLDAHALLHCLQLIENAAGRRRSVRNGPRTLDLDLVLFGTSVIETPELSVPHPRAHERDFVLEPAADLAPDMVHPRLGRTLSELRDAVRTHAAG
jgi:2-amino-4-hydroxy-6-hydroxymethyldihydropteridine diphosphokinase